MLTVMFIAFIIPYEEDGRNTSEIIGESVLILLLTLLRGYTSWMEDPEMRYGVALTQIASISAGLASIGN
jgi:hypothetical protein